MQHQNPELCRRPHFAHELVLRSEGDAQEADGRTWVIVCMNDGGKMRFTLEQAEPPLGQELDRRPVVWTGDRMIRNNIDALVNVFGLHRAVP